MAAFDSKYVVCPFYRDNNSHRICCDGISEGSTVNIVFGDSTRRKRYMECYCNNIDNYKDCKICEIQRERWSGDDGQ